MNLRQYIREVIKETLILNESDKKIIAYHGSPHGEFDKFSFKKRGFGADIHGFGDYGKGLYFTPIKSNAEAYARELSSNDLVSGSNPIVYTVELDIKNPFNFNKIVEYNKMMIPLFKKYGMLNIPQEEYNHVYKKLNSSEEEIDFFNDLESELGDNWTDINIGSKLKKKGYDSIISHDNSEIVVFNPKQVKIIDKENL